MIYGMESQALQSKNDLWKNGVVLSFDFDTEKLREHYSQSSPQGAYDVIKRFLIRNGFEHRKDSDYINYNINKEKSVNLIYQFTKNHDWFAECQNKINISVNVPSLNISDHIKEWEKFQKMEAKTKDLQSNQKQKAPIPNIDFSEIKEEKTLSIKP